MARSKRKKKTEEIDVSGHEIPKAAHDDTEWFAQRMAELKEFIERIYGENQRD